MEQYKEISSIERKTITQYFPAIRIVKRLGSISMEFLLETLIKFRFNGFWIKYFTVLTARRDWKTYFSKRIYLKLTCGTLYLIEK